MKKNKFISIDKMSENEFIQNFLPPDHNEQDKIYLKERYKWTTQKNYPYSKVSAAFQGTTFSKKY